MHMFGKKRKKQKSQDFDKDLAVGRPVTCSVMSAHNSKPTMITDGNHKCRPNGDSECRPNWSTTSGPGYLEIDLEEKTLFDQIIISWSGFWGAGTKSWKLSITNKELSAVGDNSSDNDNTNKNKKKNKNNDRKTKYYLIKQSENSSHVRNRRDTIDIPFPVNARYIKLYINSRVSAVCEVQVYNKQHTYPIETIINVLNENPLIPIEGISQIIVQYLVCKDLEDVTQIESEEQNKTFAMFVE